ncbi:MAG: hypothetical protein PUP91_34415 [Rhizonema sp. PD37]|nr:hypothetical protein [Rhizonema sp. PD37]
MHGSVKEQNVVRLEGNQRFYSLSGKPSFALAPPYDFYDCTTLARLEATGVPKKNKYQLFG